MGKQRRIVSSGYDNETAIDQRLGGRGPRCYATTAHGAERRSMSKERPSVRLFVEQDLDPEAEIAVGAAQAHYLTR